MCGPGSGPVDNLLYIAVTKHGIVRRFAHTGHHHDMLPMAWMPRHGEVPRVSNLRPAPTDLSSIAADAIHALAPSPHQARTRQHEDDEHKPVLISGGGGSRMPRLSVP